MSKLGNTINDILWEIKKGDKISWAKLLEVSYEPLLEVIKQYLYDQNYIEDVFSITFWKVSLYIRTFSFDQDGFNWLCKIAENVARRMNRKYRRSESINERIIGSEQTDISEEIAARDELERMMEGFSDREKKLIRLRFWEQLTFDELSEEFHWRKSYVYKKLDSLLKRMAKKEKELRASEEKTNRMYYKKSG